MKNYENKYLAICMTITIVSILSLIMAWNNEIYPLVLLSVFFGISGLVIGGLFFNRASCLAKMIDGSDLVVFWQYTQNETLANIVEKKEENKGMIILMIPFFSFVIAVVSLTVGFASENAIAGILITLVLIIINVIFFNVLLKHDFKEKEVILKQEDEKRSYVYISKNGVFAHGLLHYWKGWGSSLKKVEYSRADNKLHFTYMYLRPYGYGRYTVDMKIPEGRYEIIDIVKRNFVDFWLEI